MAVNANTYNSRVTTELLERKFRETFPSQAGAELVDDLYAAGCIVPVVDFSAAAAGTALDQNLQTAWDASTTSVALQNASNQTIVSGTGFYQVGVTFNTVNSNINANISIEDSTGVRNKIWAVSPTVAGTFALTQQVFVVFLRSGDTLVGTCGSASGLDVWARQIASLDGQLVNPTGFTP